MVFSVLTGLSFLKAAIDLNYFNYKTHPVKPLKHAQVKSSIAANILSAFIVSSLCN